MHLRDDCMHFGEMSKLILEGSVASELWAFLREGFYGQHGKLHIVANGFLISCIRKIWHEFG